MRRTPLLLAGALLPLCTMWGAGAARAADPFYNGMLRDGIIAYDRQDYAAAARDLRLACFGMLDEPKPLAECLVRLAVAQDRAGNSTGFGDTFRLLLDVEERFGGYTQAEVPAELRAAFEQRLVATMPASALGSVAAFRGLAARQKPEARGAGTTPAGRNERGRRDSAPPQVTPSEVRPDVEAEAPAAGAQAAPSTPRPVSGEEQQKMATARQILEGEGKTRDLKRAFQLAREVADAHAGSAEAQHLAAEAAYRLSRWQDAAVYFRRGGEPAADQPELLFYMAVALYESGDKAAAAGALQRSLPGLQKTPYVESYAKKILGS